MYSRIIKGILEFPKVLQDISGCLEIFQGTLKYFRVLMLLKSPS